MKWTIPPRILRDGEVVTLTMTSTTNPSPYIGGHYNMNCLTESTGENGASNHPKWRASSPHTGTMKFAFRPDAVSHGDRFIQVSAGNAGSDGGPSTYVLVTWKYRKGTGAGIAAAPGAAGRSTPDRPQCPPAFGSFAAA